MTRPISWKRLLAVPAALSLALGGALLTVAPANAAPGDPLVVVDPAEGTTPDARVFDISGTGSDGASIGIVDEDDAILIPVTVEAGGAWSATVSYTDDAATAQELIITQAIDITDPATVTQETLTITLPAPAPVDPTPFAVTSPADDAYIPSRFVDYEGTAPAGATVTATVGGEEGFGSFFADADGNFAFQGYIPFELGNDVTVVLTATETDGTESEPITIELSLLEPVAAPVLVSPTTGTTITGGTVTFSGTGIAGNTVVVTVGPDAATASVIFDDEDFDFSRLVPSTVVAADGSWRVSTTLPLGGYTAAALHTETPIDSIDSEVISLPSNEVAITLVAAAAGGPELAATGPTTTALAGPAALLVFAGLALLVVSRRRVGVTA